MKEIVAGLDAQHVGVLGVIREACPPTETGDAIER